MGFSKQEYWGGLQCPPPEDLYSAGIKPTSFMSPALAGGFFTTRTCINMYVVRNSDFLFRAVSPNLANNWNYLRPTIEIWIPKLHLRLTKSESPEGNMFLFSQSCPTLCNSMDCSTPGFPVLHHLQELAQIHVHRVNDAIQPSHPLLSRSPAFNLFQYHGLFQCQFFISGGQRIGASASSVLWQIFRVDFF